MSFIEDVNQSIRYLKKQEGWKSAWEQAKKYIVLPFYERHSGYLLRKSLSEPVIVPTPKIEITIRQANSNDLALFESIVPALRAKRFINKLQKNEEICYIAIYQEKIAGFVWAGTMNSPSTKTTGLTLGAKEAYFWAGYAAPEYRSQGVVRSVNLSFCKWFQEQGFEDIILLVEEENAASLKHVFQMGYQLENRINYIRILKWKRVKLEPTDNLYPLEPILDHLK